MIIQGKYNRAVCYASTLEEKAAEQIRAVCDREEFADCKIRIMPDVHAGKGCTIGTTMTVKDKVVPAMVGVDIGCGMETVRIAETDIDFERLDRVIRESVPSGMNIRETPHPLADEIDLGGIRCQKEISVDRAVRSVGTLGGGNHFIEVDKDEEGAFFLVVHSGSRHLGCEVAEYYQKEGYRALCGRGTEDVSAVIARMKSEGRASEIQATLERMRAAEKHCRTVAFPCISTGVYRFPAEAAARIAVETVRKWDGNFPEEVFFCCFRESDLNLYRKYLSGPDGGHNPDSPRA